MTLRGLPLAALAAALLVPAARAAAPPGDASAAVAADVDRLLAEHWRGQRVTPAGRADDVAVFRRLTLDLAGRVPTVGELDAFEADASPDRLDDAARRLLRGGEFAAHFATVLDEVIQGRTAGNPAFVAYLAAALRGRKGWDVVFREVMVGPWSGERAAARLFLERRARDLDAMTADVGRSFFGVDVSCARCHDHPLVRDWKREHYHGMSAFFVRTTGGKGNVGEKADGEARFAGRDGKERVVPMTFLTGKTLSDVKGAKLGRRDALVAEALAERRFFARAIVNRVWEYLFGRGLVHPPDQMHSGNPASVPALLDRLADDVSANGYDLPRLVAGLVRSGAYRRSGEYGGGGEPAEGDFAAARLRPLSPRQFSRSLVVAVGGGGEVEKKAAALAAEMDPRASDFQSSAREALFVSNGKGVLSLIAEEGGLASRLAALGDGEAVRRAFRAVLGRQPTREEAREFVASLSRRKDRRAACEDLVWALAASAEFRFNH